MTVSKRRPISAASIPSATDGVQQPRAVEMEAEVELERERVQLADLLERPDPPAARVVRVLDPEQARARRVDRRDAVRGADLLGAEAAGHAGQPARDDAGVDGRPAELGDEDVRSSPRRSARRRARCGDGSRSGSPSSRSGGRSPRPGPSSARTALLELVDGRILALLLVADRRGGDRRAHPRGRPRRGVGAEVDHGRSHLSSEALRCSARATGLPCRRVDLELSTTPSPTRRAAPSAPARCGSGRPRGVVRLRRR